MTVSATLQVLSSVLPHAAFICSSSEFNHSHRTLQLAGLAIGRLWTSYEMTDFSAESLS